MPLRSDQCICLRRYEYSESSQILALFGREIGLFRVIAKGAHRRTRAGESRFDGGIDLLDLGHAVMTDPSAKDLATLTEWKLLDGHLDLRRQYRPLMLAQYAAEMTGLVLHENDPHPELFEMLRWLLRELPTGRCEQSFTVFQLELLRLAGFLPELAACVSCGKPIEAGRVTFSPQLGGLVCGDCPTPPGPRIRSDARIIRMLQTLLRLPRAGGIPQRLPHMTRAQTDPVNRILADYLRYTLGHELCASSFVI